MTSSPKGTIALMGSGELTSTMVEVHKELLGRVSGIPRPVFLDTPAGFQLNVDQISQKALEYFERHVQCTMTVASFKSAEITTPYEAEQAYRTLREANYVLIGPGSPSYAVRQWRKTPIGEILIRLIESGGCLVAASAAALTVGRFTLPVYEIYKVGEELHWIEGMNILGHFGLDLVVVPHWNNAEGGTHDTRFCYMGGSRFERLKMLLPEDVRILGLDEHTACILHLDTDEVEVKGIGHIFLHYQGKEMVFKKGDRFSIEVLRGGGLDGKWKAVSKQPTPSDVAAGDRDTSFWDRIHEIERLFHGSLEKHRPREATNALLELDRIIWQARQDLESEEFISQARDILREMIVSLGTRLETSPKDRADCAGPVVNELLKLRNELRNKKQWQEADAIRESLARADVIVEDTKEGTIWRLK